MRAHESRDRRVLVIVPAYNEEATIASVVARVRDTGYPVCVINDGSSDQTAHSARRAGATVLDLPINLGVGGALRCGFRYAINERYDTIVQVDGDGQHDPSQIDAMLETMNVQDADIVVGSRFLEASSNYPVGTVRRLVMGALARSASKAVRSPITDATSGFRAIRSPLLDYFAFHYPIEYMGDTFEALITAGSLGARVREHPIDAIHRQYGKPSAGTMKSVWYVIRVLIAAILVHGMAPAVEPLPRVVEDGSREGSAESALGSD